MNLIYSPEETKGKTKFGLGGHFKVFQLVTILIDNLLDFCNQSGLTEFWHACQHALGYFFSLLSCIII